MSETNVTLIVALITAAVAVYGYFHGKRKEREFSLAKTRQEIYKDLIGNLSQRVQLLLELQQDAGAAGLGSVEELYAHIFANNPKLAANITKMLEINTLLCIYGTDNAIKAAASYQKASIEVAQGITAVQPDLPELVLTLRRNVFSGFSDMGHTQVSKEDIGYLMRI